MLLSLFGSVDGSVKGGACLEPASPAPSRDRPEAPSPSAVGTAATENGVEEARPVETRSTSYFSTGGDGSNTKNYLSSTPPRVSDNNPNISGGSSTPPAPFLALPGAAIVTSRGSAQDSWHQSSWKYDNGVHTPTDKEITNRDWESSAGKPRRWQEPGSDSSEVYSESQWEQPSWMARGAMGEAPRSLNRNGRVAREDRWAGGCRGGGGERRGEVV